MNAWTRYRGRLWPVLCLAALLAVPARADPPGAPWTAVDIGKPIAAGAVNVDRQGLWALQARAGAVTPRSDGLFFVHRTLEGDGSVVAMLLAVAEGTALSGTSPGAAGVAIRESAKPNARGLFLGLTSGQSPLLRFRVAPGKPDVVLSWDRRFGPGRLPMWLRWEREGEFFTPFASDDGYGWFQLHTPIRIPRFPPSALAGIAAAAAPRVPLTAVFNSPAATQSEPGAVTSVWQRPAPRVRAYAGNGSALLTWSPVPDAIGYLVRRGTPQTAGFGAQLLTPEPIRETSFTDTGLANERPLRYYVTPIFPSGDAASADAATPQEGWTAAVAVTPVYTPIGLMSLPLDGEITAVQGGVVFDVRASAYRISGAGAGDWSAADRGHMAAVLVTGDFRITARLLDRPGHLAGLMARESLDGPARFFALMGTAGKGLVTLSRARAGAAARPGKAAIAPKKFQTPVLLRLVREGARLSAFVSVDEGATFRPAGAVTFRAPLAESLYVGGFAASNTPRGLTTARFTDIALD